MNKITYEAWVEEIAHFLDFPNVEKSVEEEIKKRLDSILLTKAHNGTRPPVDVLTDYLKGDVKDEKLKMVIGLSGGSLEKLRRVYACLFPDIPWGQRVKNDRIRRAVAEFIINPRTRTEFIPEFIRKSFSLPDDWIDRLKSTDYMSVVARSTLESMYSVRMGFELERMVSVLAEEAGTTFAKGSVRTVDSKEVDIAIPDLDKPEMLIMCSYALTTSSSQTARANEQGAMYEKMIAYSRSRTSKNDKRPCVFINIVDGGGWLARSRDLRHLYDNCDYCFSYASLPKLKELMLQRHTADANKSIS